MKVETSAPILGGEKAENEGKGGKTEGGGGGIMKMQLENVYVRF